MTHGVVTLTFEPKPRHNVTHSVGRYDSPVWHPSHAYDYVTPRVMITSAHAMTHGVVTLPHLALVTPQRIIIAFFCHAAQWVT